MDKKLSSKGTTEAFGNLRDIKEFKKLLGPMIKKCNEAQIRQLQRDMFAMAELLLDLYLIKQRKKMAEHQRDPRCFDRIKLKN